MCKNKHSYWYGKAMTACGKELKWKDGTECLAGTSCNAYQNGSSWWMTKIFTACGKEPCLKNGHLCGKGTTCNQCCQGSEYWAEKAMTACGKEPCWKKGTVWTWEKKRSERRRERRRARRRARRSRTIATVGARLLPAWIRKTLSGRHHCLKELKL